MRIHVNGEGHDVPELCSVATLLTRFDLATAACAVEVNRDLVPRREHDVRALHEGDHVEIVTLVGGG